MTVGRTYLDYLQDLLGAFESASRFVQGMSFEDFADDEKTVYAVIRSLEVAGEAAKQIPTAWTQRYPAIPWSRIAGMRDVLIHRYFGVDVAVIWTAGDPGGAGSSSRDCWHRPRTGRVAASESWQDRRSPHGRALGFFESSKPFLCPLPR